MTKQNIRMHCLLCAKTSAVHDCLSIDDKVFKINIFKENIIGLPSYNILEP